MLIIQLRDIESKYFTRRNASSSFLPLFKAYHAECYFNYTLRFNRVGENVRIVFRDDRGSDRGELSKRIGNN